MPERHQGLTALTPYGMGVPSSRVRVREWIEHCRLDARIVDYAGLPNHSLGTLARSPRAVAEAEYRYRLLSRDHFDRLLIHKEVTPFSSGGLAKRFTSHADLSVYDFDDAVWRTDELATNSRWNMAGIARRLWSKQDACLGTVAAVDRVIAGSEELAEWAAEHNGDVRLIPSCVTPAAYRVKPDYEIADRPARILWLGSPATEYNLSLLAEPLHRVWQLTGAQLTVISGGTAPLPVAGARRVQWHIGVESTLADYDLAVAPLVDSPYERGKCAYKILQYGAAGLPTVASPVGANSRTVRDLGQVPATSAEQWADALIGLIQAPAAERARRGAGARLAVERGYSFDAWADAWLDAVGER